MDNPIKCINALYNAKPINELNVTIRN